MTSTVDRNKPWLKAGARGEKTHFSYLVRLYRILCGDAEMSGATGLGELIRVRDPVSDGAGDAWQPQCLPEHNVVQLSSLKACKYLPAYKAAKQSLCAIRYHKCSNRGHTFKSVEENYGYGKS